MSEGTNEKDSGGATKRVYKSGLVRTRISKYEKIRPIYNDINNRMGVNESKDLHISSRPLSYTRSKSLEAVNVNYSNTFDKRCTVGTIDEVIIDELGTINRLSGKAEKNNQNRNILKGENSTIDMSQDNHYHIDGSTLDSKYASIKNRIRLKQRFHGSDLETDVMEDVPMNSRFPNQLTSCPENHVKNISKLFEKKGIEDVSQKLIENNLNLKHKFVKNKTFVVPSVVNEYHSKDQTARNSKDSGIDIEEFRKNIISEISKKFRLENEKEDDNNSNDSFSDEEFQKIENSLNEMQSTILEMQAHHLQQKRNEQINKDEKDKERSSKTCSAIETIADGASKEEKYKENRASVEVNGYTVFIDESYQDEDDEDFGKRNFESLEDINFLEAYNRPGSELILTEVGQILHRSISQDRSSTLNYPHKLFSKETLNYENENENFRTPKDNVSPDVQISSNTVINNYFCEHDDNKRIQSGSETTESEVASNRSTLYSVSEYSDDDNRIGNEIVTPELRNKTVSYDKGVRTETYYNSQQNPVIEKVCNWDSCYYRKHRDEHKKNGNHEKRKTKDKRKIDYLIEELISTEKKYISDLEKVVTDYMPYLLDEEKFSRNLVEKSCQLFGNIKRIYARTRSFYEELKHCDEDPELIAETFLDFERLFQLYPLYSKNKPTADHHLMGLLRDIVIARQKHLGDRLGLASYLLTPVQRLGKYILFLEQIQKELTKEGTPSNKIQRAIEMVKKQMSRGNDFIAIDSIKESLVNLAAQGSFIMREKFNIIKPRKFEAMLFLFEEIIVLTSPDTRNPEMFIYRDSIRLDEMGIVTFENQPLVFHLKRFPSYKSGTKEHVEFVIEAKRKKDKKVWTEQIEKRLWEQLHKCKEEQIKLHGTQEKQLTSSKPVFRRTKSTNTFKTLDRQTKERKKSSVFYYTLESQKSTVTI